MQSNVILLIDKLIENLKEIGINLVKSEEYSKSPAEVWYLMDPMKSGICFRVYTFLHSSPNENEFKLVITEVMYDLELYEDTHKLTEDLQDLIETIIKNIKLETSKRMDDLISNFKEAFSDMEMLHAII